MIFQETKLPGAYLISLEKKIDGRGFFARSFCRKEFEDNALNPTFVQSNLSFNRKKGTLRGMHYQTAPDEEIKLVSCLTGAIYDVIIDLRPGSPTYLKWLAFELQWNNYRIIYVPKGFAHGFQALADDTTVFYQMSASYHPESARGLRWNDPALGITWPLESPIISDRDRSYEDLNRRPGL